MKNTIGYFYNIVVDDIYQNDKMYYFDYLSMRYALVVYHGDASSLNDIYNLHLEVLKRGVFVHQIILNRDGQVATLINGVPYVLMRLYYWDGNIGLSDVLSFFDVGALNGFDRFNWGDLWANKIDYLEYEINQLGKRFPLIRESFSYFVGLGETSIQLVNMVSGFNDDIFKVVAHDRIKDCDSLFDLYNPLNLVVDCRVRDVSEYFKYRFFAGDDILPDVNAFLMNSRMNSSEYLLFFARMLYPTYYFDLYEDIISGFKDEYEIKKIINRVNDFEDFLRSLYLNYRSFFQFFRIDWFEDFIDY